MFYGSQSVFEGLKKIYKLTFVESELVIKSDFYISSKTNDDI